MYLLWGLGRNSRENPVNVKSSRDIVTVYDCCWGGFVDWWLIGVVLYGIMLRLNRADNGLAFLAAVIFYGFLFSSLLCNCFVGPFRFIPAVWYTGKPYLCRISVRFIWDENDYFFKAIFKCWNKNHNVYGLCEFLVKVWNLCSALTAHCSDPISASYKHNLQTSIVIATIF